MRISSDKVVQLIEKSDKPNTIVIVAEDGNEIELDPNEVVSLMKAITYFGPHLSEEAARLSGDGVEKVVAEMNWIQFTQAHAVLSEYVEKAPDDKENILTKAAIRGIKYAFQRNTMPWDGSEG